MSMKINLRFILCVCILVGDESDASASRVETMLKNVELCLSATSKFAENLDKGDKKGEYRSNIFNSVVSLVKDFSQTAYDVDPCSICRLSSHAGNLPTVACDIIERFKLSKIEPVVMRNAYVFYGPPGTGKLTLIRSLARETDSELIEIIASSLVKEVVLRRSKKPFSRLKESG